VITRDINRNKGKAGMSREFRNYHLKEKSLTPIKTSNYERR